LAASTVYFLIAGILLQSDNANIDFIGKEQRGLSDYKSAISIYLKLSQAGDVGLIKDQIAHKTDANYPAAWNQAGDELEQENTLPDAARTLRNLIRNIGDQSNLILDPELESYYVVDILFNRIPSLVVPVAAENNGISIAHSLEGLDHAAQIIAQDPSQDSASLIKSIADFNQSRKALDRKNAVPEEQAVILQRASNMAQAAAQLLDGLLHQRVVLHLQHRSLVITFILVLYTALVVLVIFAVRNYVYKREIRLVKERQGLIEKLAQKNDELESFTYVAAHDMKEPVRTMRCFAALIKEEAKLELTGPVNDYLQIIDRAAGRAEQMIKDLLSYTKLNAEAFEFEPCDSQKEVAAVLQDLNSLIESTPSKIRIGHLPAITTVPSLFRRVVQNLIDNAIKYHKPGRVPEIFVGAERQDANWVFFVRDNGIGIDPEHTGVIFEPFRRLGRDGDGHGIGLTSCKKIVELLGGKIWVESNPGEGATFFFSLPAAESLPEAKVA
jgi:signal transduction histidine kinase